MPACEKDKLQEKQNYAIFGQGIYHAEKIRLDF